MLLPEFVKSLRTHAAETKRSNCHDKAKGSHIDNWLTTSQLVRIQDAFLDLPPGKAGRKSSLGAALAHRTAFLLSYAGALRCESTRNLELSDMSSLFAEGEGSSPCTLLILTLGQGKTNKYGKYDRTAVMRHRQPELCAQSAVALYLFYRFHELGHAFPSFEASRDWFFNKLLQPTGHGRPSGKANEPDSEDEEEASSVLDVPGPTIAHAEAADEDAERLEVHQQSPVANLPYARPLKYDSQRKAFSAALKAAEVQTTRVTHIGRAAAASLVSQQARNADQEIRRHGHWNKDVMSNCYLQSFRECDATADEPVPVPAES